MTARRSLPLLVALLFAVASLHAGAAEDSAEANVLLKFKKMIADPGGKLGSWVAGTNPCGDGKGKGEWNGAICDDGNLHGLQLENMGLSGMLNVSVGALRELPDLRTLSFKANQFFGPMPDVKNLAGIRNIFLSDNKLSGEIPDDAFQGMGSLKKLDLSRNEFSGPIPTSLARVPNLLQLRLDDNNFSGTIPDLRQKGLKLLNVSHNELEGKIPDGVQKAFFFFDGNKNLCGEAVGNPCATATAAQQSPPPPPPREKSIPVLALMTVASGGTIVIGGAIVVALKRRREEEEEEVLGQAMSSKKYKYKYTSSSSSSSWCREEKLENGAMVKQEEGRNDQGRLVFVKGGRERFELQDLLKCSAEVLGTGNLGCTYRATFLQNGPSVVVKRSRDMNGTRREDFEEHMRRLGRLSHPNLLPLLAYHYRKEEKLLVHDYVPNGSLALILHGNPAVSNHPMILLDWAVRLKIVKGVARGMAYLYEELPMLGLPHGHLKSSNVLLGDSLEPLLTDYALVPVANQSRAARFMVAYKSPERKHTGATSKKSDVWSLGMLILEILTGKVPMHDIDTRQAEESTDLVDWVNSVPVQEWPGRVLDTRITMTPRNAEAEGEMLKLLHVALACCHDHVDKRWEIHQAAHNIEHITEERAVPVGTTLDQPLAIN